MKIKVLYFARLREAFGRPAEEIELPPGVTNVAGLIAHLRTRGGPGADLLAETRMVRYAVNQDMAMRDTPLADNDEVAIFPPVTGG